MKLRTLAIVTVALLLAGPLFGEEGAPLKEKRDRVSYAYGVEVGRVLKNQSVDLNLEVLKEAVRAVLSGEKLLLSDHEMAEIRAGAEKEASDLKEKRHTAMAEKNRKEEEKFLGDNRKKEGVVELPSGLQYKVIKAGAGKKPKEDDMIMVNYRVALLDGTEIESSREKGAPQTFALENVVPGWREGALLMGTGSIWRLFVPSRLAYGEDGVGAVLGPNTMLIFDLELLKILDKPVENADDKSADKTQERGG